MQSRAMYLLAIIAASACFAGASYCFYRDSRQPTTITVTIPSIPQDLCYYPGEKR